MRKIIHAAKCSQRQDPIAGTGPGNDMCTEAVGAMINGTYLLGPKAKAGVSPQVIMHDMTAWIPNNQGNPNVSHLENFGVWFPAWLAQNHYTQIHLSNTHNPSWADVLRVIDAGHIAVVGVNDCSLLRLFNNTLPYGFPGHAGHVMLLVGYDTDFVGSSDYGPTVIVNDPMRALGGMPYDYSFKSLQDAGFDDLTEIAGAALPYDYVTPSPAPSTPTPDLARLKALLQEALNILPE